MAQNRKPEDQVFPWTSWLARQAGEFMGYSPAKIDHLIDGLTGGLLRKAEKPIESSHAFSLRKDYSESVDKTYGKQTELRQERGSAKFEGRPPGTGTDQEYRRINRVTRIMSDLRDLRGLALDRDERFKIEKYIIGLGRFAMREQPLERYPLLFSDANAPTAV